MRVTFVIGLICLVAVIAHINEYGKVHQCRPARRDCCFHSNCTYFRIADQAREHWCTRKEAARREREKHEPFIGPCPYYEHARPHGFAQDQPPDLNFTLYPLPEFLMRIVTAPEPFDHTRYTSCGPPRRRCCPGDDRCQRRRILDQDSTFICTLEEWRRRLREDWTSDPEADAHCNRSSYRMERAPIDLVALE